MIEVDAGGVVGLGKDPELGPKDVHDRVVVDLGNSTIGGELVVDALADPSEGTAAASVLDHYPPSALADQPGTVIMGESVVSGSVGLDGDGPRQVQSLLDEHPNDRRDLILPQEGTATVRPGEEGIRTDIDEVNPS